MCVGITCVRGSVCAKIKKQGEREKERKKEKERLRERARERESNAPPRAIFGKASYHPSRHKSAYTHHMLQCHEHIYGHICI